jgi:putative nucleotidyltransferase with HDIG domain
MGTLDNIGLGRKMRGAGYLGDKRKDDPFVMSKNGYVKTGILTLFFIGLILFYPGGLFQDVVYKVGEPWRDDDLIAPITFALLKSEAEINAETAEIASGTAPIFTQKIGVNESVQQKLDTLFSQTERVLDLYATYRMSLLAGSASASDFDSLRYMQERSAVIPVFDSRSWSILTSQYAVLRIAEASRSRVALDRFIGVDVRIRTEFLISELFAEGVIDTPKSTLGTPGILVRNPADRTQKALPVAQLRDLPEVRDYAQYRFSRTLGDDAAHVAQQVLQAVIEPNLVYNEQETRAKIDEAVSAISPTKGAIPVGELIIRKGDLITASTLNVLESLAAARMESRSTIDHWQRIAGNLLVILAIFSTYLLYLYLYRNPIFDHNLMLTLVLLAVSMIVGLAFFIARTEALSLYLVPIAIAPIILTIIFDSRVGLMTTTTLALMVGFINGNDFEYVVAAITAGSMAVFSVRDVKNRSQFFLTTPGLVFISYFFVTLGFTLLKSGAWDGWISNMSFVAGSVVLIWLTYPLILLFEKLFKVTTDVSLLELNDNNHPLLKLLMTQAPGTFQHSLQVANLGEAAASAIGANSLLCRVGALYHDVGKTDRPEYFVENQMGGPNEHDKLKPRMSVLVIKNHVAQGVKLAEEHQLPDIVIDFIKTHHGTSVIRYFYEKARDQAETEAEVREEDFRYEGPLPHTKETGILLLADCVEASARAMSDPSYTKLENLVNKMVDERLAEGQLNNCPLTFQDLRIIKETFRTILVGVYHQRIKYPGNA